MRRACGGKGQRREQNREQSARMGTGNTERTRLPRRVSPKSDAFFQFSCSRAALESRRLPSASTTLYSVPLSSVLVVRASWCPPVSPYTPHSSSLLSSLPSPTDPSLSPPRPPANPEPSFVPLCSSSSSLSSLSCSRFSSAVSTSISKKSSRELFVGKCREPAVLRTG